MANTIKEYKCPTCTAPLKFSATSGKLECEFCNGIFEPEEIEKRYEEEGQETLSEQNEEIEEEEQIDKEDSLILEESGDIANLEEDKGDRGTDRAEADNDGKSLETNESDDDSAELQEGESSSAKEECATVAASNETVEAENLTDTTGEKQILDEKDSEGATEKKEDKKKESKANRKKKLKVRADWDSMRPSVTWGEESKGMAVYNCPSCGAELLCAEELGATSCPYCGNVTVFAGQFSGDLRPDYIIPFKLSKEKAESALKAYYRRKPLLPSAFKKSNQIKEIKGIYVPFWFFNGEADAEARFHATRSRRYVKGNYRVTETMHYKVERSGNIPFERIPVDASKKMPDALMDSIEPFDYSELQSFSTAYMPGYLADRYDVSVDESRARAKLRVSNTSVALLKESVIGYESVKATDSSVRIKNAQVHYGLLPVYLLHTKWKDKDYLFAMNGQTGKMRGELPIDKVKEWIVIVLVLIIVTMLFGRIVWSLLYA